MKKTKEKTEDRAVPKDGATKRKTNLRLRLSGHRDFFLAVGDTIHSNYRQVVFSITLNFPLEFTQEGLPELGSGFKEIFLVALFEKNPKLIIFHPIMHPDFRELLENLFR